MPTFWAAETWRGRQAEIIINGCTSTVSGSQVRGQSGLSEVIIQEDENFERALKRFKKKVEKAGILADLRKHRHYEKPSEKRKRKMNAATRKNRRHRPM